MNTHDPIIVRDSRILTNATSLITTSFVMLSNILIGWGTLSVVNACMPVMLFHNGLDLVLHYKKNDILMNTHHIMVCIGILYYYIFTNMMRAEILDYAKWILLAEFSSFFNSMRYHLVGTPYYYVSKLIFGFVFLLVRTVSSVGVIYWLQNNKNDPDIIVLLLITILYLLLNSIWGSMIILQIAKKQEVILSGLGCYFRKKKYGLKRTTQI